MKIMLRRTDSGELTDHTFIDNKHACDWLKEDTGNESRYTVCIVEQVTHGPAFGGGYFHSMSNKVLQEMTVSEFIKKALIKNDEEKKD